MPRERNVGRKGYPVTRYQVYDAIVALWTQLGRPPCRKDIMHHLGIGQTRVTYSVNLLIEEGRIDSWLVPTSHRAVLVPLTAAPPSV